MAIPLRLPSFLLGFALGGFLDGILLHQILQWHHVVSGVTDAADLRLQTWADGLFHAAHYLLMVAGLVMLHRRRRVLAEPGAGRLVTGWALLGFGAWHLLDAVLNHWLLGLHRINELVADPLPWDLVFFGLGCAAVLLGWLLLRRGGGGAGRVVAAGLAALALGAAPVAVLPPPAPDPAITALLQGRALPAFCGAWTRLAAAPAAP
jgi:uncharacterized membrane protein